MIPKAPVVKVWFVYKDGRWPWRWHIGKKRGRSRSMETALRAANRCRVRPKGGNR